MESNGLNKTNTFLNLLSGNCYPIKMNDDYHSTGTKFYMAFSWLITSLFFITTSVVVFFIPGEIALQSSTVCSSIVVEGIVVGIYMNSQRSLLRKLVNKMQEILIENDTLNESISQTLNPISQPIRFYLFCSIFGAGFWNSLAFFRLFDQNQFTYTDFVIPSYFPFEPFAKKSFAIAVLIQVIGSLFVSAKKFSTDVYVIYIIALLTAQYKYLRNDLANILGNGENKTETIIEQDEYRNNSEDRLKTWIKHHQDVLAISRMLKDLTALNVLFTSANCTFRFCFLAYMLIKTPMTFFEKCIIVIYAGASLTQLFMLCYCVQELSDSSQSVTTDAFHSRWFMLQESKKNFTIIITADKIRSGLSGFGIVDLSLATFTQIINHAYSGCLFLQNAG